MADYKKAPAATPSFIDVRYDDLLTEKQLAKRYKCSPKTLRNLRVKKCYVPFIKIERQVRYRLSDVIAYEQANRVACGDEKMGTRATSSVDPREETFLTPRELARHHQREEKTLRNDRVQRRYISFYKLGGQVRYALSDVIAYEHAHRATSTTPAQTRDAQQHAPSRANARQEDRMNPL